MCGSLPNKEARLEPLRQALACGAGRSARPQELRSLVRLRCRNMRYVYASPMNFEASGARETPQCSRQSKGACHMRCFLIRSGRIANVELLPDLSDEEAIKKSQKPFAERGNKYDGFELWDRARFVLRHEGQKAVPA
jgi:hypothetical protein